MLADWREIIREVSIASNLDEALATLVRRIKDSLAVDAFAVYLSDVIRCFEDIPAGFESHDRQHICSVCAVPFDPRYARLVLGLVLADRDARATRHQSGGFA